MPISIIISINLFLNKILKKKYADKNTQINIRVYSDLCNTQLLIFYYLLKKKITKINYIQFFFNMYSKYRKKY